METLAKFGLFCVFALGLLGAAPRAACGFEQAETKPEAKPRPRLRMHVGGTVLERQLIQDGKPEYPADAKRNHIHGEVRLRVLVGTDGKVEDVKTLAGDKVLAESATEAVKKWLFKPIELQGDLVEQVSEIVFDFNSGKRRRAKDNSKWEIQVSERSDPKGQR